MEEHTPAEHHSAEGSDHSGAPATAVLEATIADVVCVMIEDRKQREQEIAEVRRRHDRKRAEERRRYEEESERRIRDMTKQLELLREMVTAHNARPIASPREGGRVSQINSPLGQRRHRGLPHNI